MSTVDKRHRQRSRSRSRTRHRPSLGSKRNSAKSIITIKSEEDLPPDSHGSSEFDDLEVPSINATLDHTLPVDYFKQDLLSILQQLRIPKWHRLPSNVSDDIRVKRISGALTNAIYKVEPPSLVILKSLNLHSHLFPSLLLRIYGPNVESLIDRDYELRILARLSKQNIGPKLFGCFNNGRVEQFLDNAITLTREDIRDKKTSARIARRMRELHDGIKLSRAERNDGPIAWKNIDKWLELIDDMLTTGVWTLNEKEIFNTDFKTFKKYVLIYKDWLFKKYKNLETLENLLVFCHNDAQYGNLLFTSPRLPLKSSSETSASTTSLLSNFSNLSLEDLSEIKPSKQEKKQDQNLVVIDFEYSGPNVRGYDLANHFCEWMHNYHDPKFSYAITESRYPNLEEQLNLIYSYILFNNPEQDVTKLEKEAKSLFNECIYWRPCVNLRWALWGIIQNGENEVQADDIVELGPYGEQYKIVRENAETAIVDDDEEDDDDEQNEDIDGPNGSNVDSFENLKYSRDKINVFWGDLLQLGLVEKEVLEEPEAVKHVVTKLFDEAI